jgi:hypothetical protein
MLLLPSLNHRTAICVRELEMSGSISVARDDVGGEGTAIVIMCVDLVTA